MIVLAGILLGLVGGTRLAARHGGARADKVQYALACAIAGALGGLILTLVVERLAA
jgi:hypothetical protein